MNPLHKSLEQRIEGSYTTRERNVFAANEAIAFAEWMLKEGWGIASVSSWRNFTKEVPMDYTTGKLYQLYLESKKP